MGLGGFTRRYTLHVSVPYSLLRRRRGVFQHTKSNTDERSRRPPRPAPAAPRSVLPPSLALRGRRGLSSSRSRRARSHRTHINDSISIKKRAPYGCIGIRNTPAVRVCLDARGTNASPASHCPSPPRACRVGVVSRDYTGRPRAWTASAWSWTAGGRTERKRQVRGGGGLFLTQPGESDFAPKREVSLREPAPLLAIS
jgi:hypothetical protein